MANFSQSHPIKVPARLMTSIPLTPRVAVLIAIGLLIAGCGGAAPAGPETGAVTGTVTLDGEPLSEVLVMFQPEDGKLGQASMGKTDEDGHYELTYSTTTKGAVVGSHKVTVTTPTTAPDPKFKDPIPKKYNSKTELKEEVQAGENVVDLALSSN